MSERKPNHICKNVNCKNGVDGKPKTYWACNDCDKLHSYREVACCPECFQEYMVQVQISRNEIQATKQDVKENTVIDIETESGLNDCDEDSDS